MMQWFKPIAMKLNRRERAAVLVGVGFLCLFVVVRFVVFPFMDRKDRLKRNLVVNTRNLEEIRSLKSEYETLVSTGEQAEKRFKQRRKSFTLLSFLVQVAGEVGIKDKMASMKPTLTQQKDSPYKISQVEMKLKGLTLEQITQYLYKIETSKNMVNIKRISLTKSDDQMGILNVTLQVETLEV
jgi:general secretion pathway protein M